MKDLILRFATLNAQNVIGYVYVAMAVVWVVLVATALLSIRSENFGTGSRMLWVFLVVCLPIVGMAFYCFRCLAVADYPLLRQLLPSSNDGGPVSYSRKH